jgi:hypothetical protein
MASNQGGAGIVQCVMSFSGPDNILVQFGELLSTEDPIVKKWPQHFGPPRVRVFASHVEQATAAPGEKRHFGRPAKKAAPKKVAPVVPVKVEPVGKALSTGSFGQDSVEFVPVEQATAAPGEVRNA